MRYSKFPCADHSNEPLKAEIVFARGLHDFLSFISIAQKETLHIGFVPNPETKRYFKQNLLYLIVIPVGIWWYL